MKKSKLWGFRVVPTSFPGLKWKVFIRQWGPHEEREVFIGAYLLKGDANKAVANANWKKRRGHRFYSPARLAEMKASLEELDAEIAAEKAAVA